MAFVVVVVVPEDVRRSPLQPFLIFGEVKVKDLLEVRATFPGPVPDRVN
jgi:hypothetical protein